MWRQGLALPLVQRFFEVFTSFGGSDGLLGVHFPSDVIGGGGWAA